MASEVTEEAAERRASAGLVERICSGDLAAESEMVERYGRGLFYLLSRRTHDKALAEDLYQDTFRTAIEKLRSGPIGDPERLAGYLYGIANNLATAHHRKQARRSTESDSDFVANVPEEAAAPAERLSRDELARTVRELLAELSQDRDREVLRRFYVLEEPKALICAALDLDEKNFNNVLHRARQRFAELLQKQERRHTLRAVE